MSITQRHFCYQGPIKNKNELTASIPQPEQPFRIKLLNQAMREH